MGCVQEIGVSLPGRVRGNVTRGGGGYLLQDRFSLQRESSMHRLGEEGRERGGLCL